MMKMMKDITNPLQPAAVLLGTFLCSVEPASAATIAAANCSQSSVQSAINSAKNNDTVAVPAGTCTWSSSVSINGKTIVLTGAGSGAGGTKIVYGGSGHTLVSINPGGQTGKVDVSGFYFSGGDGNYWGGMAIEFDGPVGWKNLRIHHNLFENKLWTLRGAAYIYGLIDHNTFQGSAYGMIFRGRGDIDWSTPLVLGTADFFFVEDNTFNWDDWYGNTGAPTVDMENGGRVVFRNNSVKYGMVETHDMPRNGSPSANAWEIYNNKFSRSSGNQWKGLDISAGTGVIWGNTFTGDYSVPVGGIDYKSFDPRNSKLCDGSDPKDQNVAGQSGWRCQYQIGSQGQGATAVGYPAYIWSNTVNGASTGMNVTAGANHVQVSRDYFNNGSTPKPGYTQYTYPHPLQNGSAGKVLEPPRGLHVVP
jgi:hypothetical protein